MPDPYDRAFLNITPQVEQCLSESGIREGLCLVNAMHISASVFINDDESGLHRDFEKWCPATIKNGSRRQLEMTPDDNYKTRSILG